MAKSFKQELEHLINIYKDEVRQNDYDIYKNNQQYVDKPVIVGCYKLIIKDLEKLKLLYEKKEENKLIKKDFEQWICDHTYNTYDEKNDSWLPDKIWVLKNNTKYDKLEE